MKFACYILSAVMIFFGACALQAQETWRVIQADQIRLMNTFERTQYEKAMKLMQEQNFAAAASEFERYLIQYKDGSSVIPYIIFMHAYATHQAKNRNKAVGIYNEVWDFYPDEINAAAPALFYRGIAQLESGDYAKAMRSFQEVMDDEDYRLHPVAAQASIRLVENHWKNKEFDKGTKYLRQIYTDFRVSAPEPAVNAFNMYLVYTLFHGKTQEFIDWHQSSFIEDYRKQEKGIDDMRVELGNHTANLFYHGHFYNWYFHPDRETLFTGGKKAQDPAKSAWTILNGFKDAYIKLGREWEFYYHAVRLLGPRPTIVPANEFSNIVQEALAFIAKTPDDEQNIDRQQKRYAELADLLIGANRPNEATIASSRLADPKKRAMNEYRILVAQEKWADALKQAESAVAAYAADAEYVKSLNWSRVWVMKEKTRQYDDAIKVLGDISELPRTLWEKSDIQWRKGDLQAAMSTLIEIENAFSDQGPRAAWTRAHYYRQAKNNEMAIKEARLIMKKYPKSQESSWAHQMLEDYGVDSSGGITEE